MAADSTADAHDAGLQVAESLLVAPGGAADAHDASCHAFVMVADVRRRDG